MSQLPLLMGYMVISIITFFFYAKDKAAARAGRRRTPERTLHLLALVGGWPGAVLAQQWLRHKTKKRRFRLIFWLTVFLNISLVGVVLTLGLEIHLDLLEY